eukprot:scaffold12889_cov105-Isochrysis_galbana.AAC.3
MPRLPSALGLGGAKRTGGLDWTLDPPMRSDSPNSPNPPSPPPPSSPCTHGSYRLERGGGWTSCTTSVLSIGWVERGESTLNYYLGLEILPSSLTFPPLV